jgi:pyrroloquinoline quinone (PQQ) biosynthesis protein C
MVCSIDQAALRRVAEAIDQLDAERRSADPAQLAAQIAAIWAMVAEMDPNLARLASRYATPAD